MYPHLDPQKHNQQTQIFTQMQQLMQRAHRQPTSTDKYVMSLQKHFDGYNPSAARIIGQLLRNMLPFKQDKVQSIYWMCLKICSH